MVRRSRCHLGRAGRIARGSPRKETSRVPFTGYRPPVTALAGASRLARSVGEALLTVGVVLMLFVVYQLVWTNLEAQRAHGRIAQEIREAWEGPPRTPVGGARRLTETERRPRYGQGFAILRIPRLGQEYAVPVLEGVRLEVLARGVGHYPRTAMPGQRGNFALAGHRATNGEPFAHLDRLRRGDKLLVETRRSVYAYVVSKTRIVRPVDTWVIDPVPGRRGVRPVRRLITLTTCNPRWGSSERLIVSGRLVRALPRDQ